ncbi:MAG: TolC family protein, partial [Flavobacteriaceae bacterium]
MFRHKITLFLLLLSSVLTAQNKEVLNISVLIDQRTDRYLEDSELLFNEVRNVIGNEIPIHVDYVLENNYNLDKARENYDFLKDKNQDVILVFGVVDNMMIYQKNPDFHSATIVFGSVNRDFIPIESSKTTSGIHNLNYLITPISFSEDLRDFRELYDYKRLAILIDDYTLDLLPVEDLMAKILEDELGHYEIIPVDEDFVKNGDLSGFDAYYVAAGSNLSSQAHDDFIGRITAFNQPSFSAYGKEDVIKGIMASNQSDGNIQQIFRRIALNIERIFEDGDNASDIPVNIQYSKGLTLNFNVAEEVGLGIKYNLISETEFVGDFNKVFGDEKYSLIDVVDKTLSQNLSLKSSEQNIAIQGQELKSVFSNYFPDLGISATGLYVDPELVAATGGFNQEYSVKGTAQLNQLLYS